MSSKKRIERLELINFRGATRSVVFEFQSDQPIVLIFGENGSGKSTIADALDFLCNSDFGSIRLRSGTTPRTHIVSSQGKATDLEVQMVYGGQKWRAILQSGKPVTSPSQPPRAFVLRRADITRIMEATDGERYKTLQEFITVPHIESTEGALRTAYKTVRSEVDRAIQQKNVAITTMQNFWEAEGKPGKDYLSWAKTAVSHTITDLKKQIILDKKVVDALDQAIRANDDVATAEYYLEQAQAEQLNLEEQLQQLSLTQPNADILATLQAAKTYLTHHSELNRCPVCAKPESNAALLVQIETQLTQLHHVQTLRQQADLKTRAVQEAEGALSAALRNWHKGYAELVGLLPTAPEPMLVGVTISPDSNQIDEAKVTLQQLTTNRPSLIQRIEQAQKVVNQRNAMTTHLVTIENLQEVIETQYLLSQRLQAMLSIVEDERKQYVQATIDGISELVGKLYNRIHPDEPLGSPSFGLKQKTAGSLTLTGTFGDNRGIPPAAYYSEAHLDTLGLCVYLALAKQSGNALIVLDDILMSVDDPHLNRVIDLINEEAPNFGHVIITTHSRAWFDRMRQGRGMQAQLIELYGWDLNNGMHHSNAPLAIEDLRDVLHSPRLDRQLIASRAGILLEQLLDELTLRYRSRLPRKNVPRYTLGEMAGGFDGKLQNLLRIEQIDAEGVITETKLYPLIANATNDMWIRNQVGAHFNPDAAGISDAMVRQFGEKVLTLADTLLCDHCRQLPRKNKSGSYLECGGCCGKIRLYPLVAP